MTGLLPIIRRPRIPLDDRPRIVGQPVVPNAPASSSTLPAPPSPGSARGDEVHSDSVCSAPGSALLAASPSLPAQGALSLGPRSSILASRPSTPLSAFLARGLDLGCPADQLRNFHAARIVLQSKQLAASAAARRCDLPDGPTAIGYGGARGGGKTFWLFAQMGADDCQRYPGLKCLLLRKVGKSNLENFDDLRRRHFTRLDHAFSLTRGLLEFANGSRIIAGHYQCEKDIDAYLGLEYDVIGIEEATTLTARKYQDIVTCCRTSKPGWRPRIYSSTNPGGVGHAWYRATYVDPFLRRAEAATRFIPATFLDNAFTNPEYRITLDNLTGWQQRAWRDGDWDIAAGQFFTNFRRDVHVIDEFNDQRGIEWFAAMDYGFTHYTVILLACTDCDGNLYIVDEHAERKRIPEFHAAAFKEMLKRHHVALERRYSFSIALQRFVAGTDLFAKQSTGLTIAEQYRQLGLRLTHACMDRVNGWAAILKRLGDPAIGMAPTLFIHRRCTRLIDCLPTLQHDPNHPEDVLKADLNEDGIGGDDAADALRYLIATQPRRIEMRRLSGL